MARFIEVAGGGWVLSTQKVSFASLRPDNFNFAKLSNLMSAFEVLKGLDPGKQQQCGRLLDQVFGTSEISDCTLPSTNGDATGAFAAATLA